MHLYSEVIIALTLLTRVNHVSDLDPAPDLTPTHGISELTLSHVYRFQLVIGPADLVQSYFRPFLGTIYATKSIKSET